MKARPGPAFATWSTGIPVLNDMKPRIEKTANPAKTYFSLLIEIILKRSSLTDVKQSQAVTITQSLYEKEKNVKYNLNVLNKWVSPEIIRLKFIKTCIAKYRTECYGERKRDLWCSSNPNLSNRKQQQQQQSLNKRKKPTISFSITSNSRILLQFGFK